MDKTTETQANHLLMKYLVDGIISRNDYINLAELFNAIIKQITPKNKDRERLAKVMTGEIIETTISKLENAERLLNEKEILLEEKNAEIIKLKKQIEELTVKSL